MSNLKNATFSLLKHELKLELKNKNNLFSLIIYSLSSIYITYLCFRQNIDGATWNALYWIILLFAATNAVVKSFLADSKGLQLYYLTLLPPRPVILSKTIYNFLLLVLIGIVNFITYRLLFGTIIADSFQFLVGLLLGSFGLSTVLTLMAGLVSRVNNSTALIAILAFPLLLPLLIIIIQFSNEAIQGNEWAYNNTNLILLLSLDVIIFALSYLLFPYLWHE
jgi:heme exporter protein B